DQAYREAFREYGLDVEALEPHEAAQRLRARNASVELPAALDDWALIRSTTQPGGGPGWKDLLAVARAIDPDPWRNRVRDAWVRRDNPALTKLVAEEAVAAQPASTLILLGRALRQNGAGEQAITLLRKAQQWHPADFWINFELADCLASARPPQLEEAIRFEMAAIALRPHSAAVRNNLGVALDR